MDIFYTHSIYCFFSYYTFFPFNVQNNFNSEKDRISLETKIATMHNTTRINGTNGEVQQERNQQHQQQQQQQKGERMVVFNSALGIVVGLKGIVCIVDENSAADLNGIHIGDQIVGIDNDRLICSSNYATPHVLSEMLSSLRKANSSVAVTFKTYSNSSTTAFITGMFKI